VFAWSYKELRGFQGIFLNTRLNLWPTSDPKYALKIRKYLDKLLDARFIYPIETTQCLLPLMIISKNNGKLTICVD
jgi:hypothetical protein